MFPAAHRVRVDDGPMQEYRASPRGLLDLILVHTRPGFVHLDPRAREEESIRCYRLLPEYRRNQLGNLSRMLRRHPVDSLTPRELALIRLAWEFAFRGNPTLRPRRSGSEVSANHVPSQLRRPGPYTSLPAHLPVPSVFVGRRVASRFHSF